MTPADFDELVGAEGAGDDRERMRRAHDALLAAGALPELPPTLQRAPAAPARVAALAPARRRLGALALAAALAAAAFGAGYLARGGDEFDARAVPMRGTGPERDATALIRLGDRDESGNWPMVLEVRGLPMLEDPRAYYELVLTRNGKVVGPCGSFKVHRGTTRVYLNAPYALKRFDGWAVLAHPRGHTEHPAKVMTT